jgi:hypothetical protein
MAIRLPAARWRRVPSALTRHRERSLFRARGWRASTRQAPIRCCAVAMFQRLARRRPLGFTAIVWRGDSLPHARQDRQASSVVRPLEGQQRPKKPGPSLLQVASPVWRGAPVCLRLPVFLRVVNWPLVQIPTDRHTTTGTCVLGKVSNWAKRCDLQALFSRRADFFRAVAFPS